MAARREEREIAEAHASSQRQAARWNDSEVRRRNLAGPQPSRVPGLSRDPYEANLSAMIDGRSGSSNSGFGEAQPQQYQGLPDGYREETTPLQEEQSRASRQPDSSRPRGYRPDQSSGVRQAYGGPAVEAPVRSRISQGVDFSRGTQQYSPAPADRLPEQREDFSSSPDRGWQAAQEPSAPAWLFGNGSSAQTGRPSSAGATSVADTLQHSRERVASRWFALKGVFESGQETLDQPLQDEVRTPLLAVFSLAGGVGKTSMVATLGRTLSSLGEKVLLADTTSHGLLPYYFGATELKPGIVRNFSPPSGSSDAPIHLVSYDVDQRGGNSDAQEALAEEITESVSGMERVLIDLNSTSGWLMRRFPRMAETVLVPLAADMNSVISLQSVEKYFAGAVDADGGPLLPYYVLNQFDASLPLHLDVREVLRRQLGERLLPFVIRRSPAVSEALAEGMTVFDYAAEGAISEDYLNIATWLRSVSAPATHGTRTVRWSER
jgi:cellulose synthase operon protein YhjQ